MAKRQKNTKVNYTSKEKEGDEFDFVDVDNDGGSTTRSIGASNANPKFDQLEQQLQAHEQEIQSNMAKLKQDTQALKDRKQDILDRQQALLQQNGGTQVAGHDIIRLNVSGTEMFARRDTLTVVEGSRLEALFSGRWENQLKRDALGRIFMGVKVEAFKKILEYLYIVKLSSESSKVGGEDDRSAAFPLLPHIELAAVRDTFDKHMDFFRLKQDDGQDSCRKADKEETIDDSSLKDTINRERAILDVMEKELDELERRLAAEESFVELFLAKTKQSSDNNTNDERTPLGSTAPRDFLTSSKESNDDMAGNGSSQDTNGGSKHIPASVHDEDLGILNLLIGGEIIVAEQSTLCHDPNSKLAQEFSNDKWLQEHLVVTEQGKRCFLVEQPLSAFQKLLDHLHLKTISSDEDVLPPIKIDWADEDSDIFIRMYDYYFPSGSNVIELHKPPRMDSVIIEESSDVDKLQEWLQSVNHNSAPKLLYRASRDGWDANDFHRACDGKGATITIVKSSGGYIFGGFTDKSWSSNGGNVSSDNAFVFHLKCHSGVPAEKYGMRKDYNAAKKYGMRKDYNGRHTRYAMYSHSSSGPTFGYNSRSASYDLDIASNANVNYSNCNGIGNNYTCFAWNNRQSSFLTGSNQFQVSEYEVFQV